MLKNVLENAAEYATIEDRDVDFAEELAAQISAELVE